MKPSVLQVMSHLHIQVTLWELPAQPLMRQQDRRFGILDHVSQPLLWVMGVHWQVCPSRLQHSCSRQQHVADLHSFCSRQQGDAGLHSVCNSVMCAGGLDRWSIGSGWQQ